MATVRKLRNKWQAQVRIKGHKPQAKSFTLKSDAVAWARQIETEIQRGVFVDTAVAERMSVREAIERYLSGISDSKKQRIERSTGRPVVASLGHVSLFNLSNQHLADFRDEQLQLVGPTTVVHRLSLLSKVLKIAAQEWNVPFPKGVPSVRKPKRPRGRDRRLQEGELESLLEALSETPAVQQIVILAVETAMRRGELVKIEWTHINWTARTLHIPETKTGVPRDVPLSERAIALMNEISASSTQQGRMFALQPDSVSQAFERACRRAGIEGLRFHDLRHEATSRFFEMGLNTMEVATITGHKTLEMLNRYTHLRAETLVDRLVS
ncbi:site-specific integrase [Marinobacterium mangrovicola]|uniref:Phage integrase family protein n=1 Tax=Marinobacterium mangrovicola TaxID=1476959 RepID=A0A4R1GGQ0_9GAMM|nr:site-specific integrase [Marinobacterium mangrovicola]TCK06131.1 phage integrase family protein [Marinobacterium mangrovicola]